MIAILTDPGIGGTFLSWSLHFLAGHNRYYHAQTDSYCDLTDNPLTGGNSHNFLPNQANSLESFKEIYTGLSRTKTDQFHTIYFRPVLLFVIK